MSRVTVLGGSLVDAILQLPKRYLQRQLSNQSLVLPFGSKLESNSYLLCPGGSGANVAVGLQKLGLNTTFMTDLSDDILGQFLDKSLGDSGMDLKTCCYKEPSSLSVVLRVSGERTIITAHNEEHKYLTSPLPETGHIHIGPIGLSENEEVFYQKLIAHIIKSDQAYSLNPSMLTIEKRQRYFLSILRSATILFVNYEEGLRLSRLQGKPDPKEILTVLLRLGPKVVCLTCGEKGAYVGDGNQLLFARALLNDDPDEMDATGAGDAFTSGFLATFISSKQDRREQLELALEYGIVNSAAVVCEVGGQNGLLTDKQIQKDLKAVKVIVA